MYTLGIDATTRKTRLALLKKNEVLFEREWSANANESETVIKTIKSLTEITPLLFEQLEKIITIHGPGGFNGTRVAVTIANTLQWLTKGSIIAHDTFTWWKKRLTGEHKKSKPRLLLKLTEHEIFLDGKPIEFEKFLKEVKKRKSAYHAYGELTPSQHLELKKYEQFQWIEENALKKFGEVLKELGGKSKKTQIAPVYFRPPHITKSKKTPNYRIEKKKKTTKLKK